jgi:LPS O-antigen subunit length determinant protein (WzzB/FepE family)
VEVNVTRKIMIMLIVLMIICVGFLSGCLQNPSYSDTNMVNPTNVEIIGRITRTGFEGFDYVVYVDVTVDNRVQKGKRQYGFLSHKGVIYGPKIWKYILVKGKQEI